MTTYLAITPYSKCLFTYQNMLKMSTDINALPIIPTRKMTAREQKVFDRVLTDFVHLTPSDSEMLTQYAEAVVRYETAAKEAKKNPTISLPVINRASGNIVGHKDVRNPAFVTVREAQSQANSLARRLMIDAVSAEKRQRLQARRLQALAAKETKEAAQSAAEHGVTEEQIQMEMERCRSVYINCSDSVLRHEAMWYLTVCKPLEDDPEANEGLYPD